MDGRIHKVLAEHGIGSRREIENWIREGRVKVNGVPAVIGQRIGAADRIRVDGRDISRRLAGRQPLRVIVYHKPGGEILRQRKGDDRTSVEARLPGLRSGRWLPVNALGFTEDGLLILANDGSLATALSRCAHDLPVEYRVRVLRPRNTDVWPEIPRALDLDGKAVAFSAVEPIESGSINTWFRVAANRTLPRGAIAQLFDDAGLKTSRTMLVGWGPVSLPRDLPRGRHRELEGKELDALLALAGRRKDAAPTAGKKKAHRSQRDSKRRATARRNAGR